MSATEKTHDECVKRLSELIKDIKVAMLTTVDSGGHLRSRPMMTQDRPFDGTLVFFTNHIGGKADEIRNEQNVNLSYASPSKNDYVSISGVAWISQDSQEIRELWNPVYSAWFPQGLDDPNLALLKVQVIHAEYWDSPSGQMEMISGFIKKLFTGEEQAITDHQKVNM